DQPAIHVFFTYAALILQGILQKYLSRPGGSLILVNFKKYYLALMSLDLDRFRLKSLSFFGMLERDVRRFVREQISIRELKKGQMLFREGTLSKGVYIVRKGRVKIFHANDDGKESIIYIYKRAEFFGYRPLLAGEPHPVTAAALDSAEV